MRLELAHTIGRDLLHALYDAQLAELDHPRWTLAERLELRTLIMQMHDMQHIVSRLNNRTRTSDIVRV